MLDRLCVQIQYAKRILPAIFGAQSSGKFENRPSLPSFFPPLLFSPSSLQAHLRRWTDVLVTNVSQTGRRGDEVAVCLHIMEMMYMLPAATFRLLEPLLMLMVKAEKALGIEVTEFY